jgi:hypothetical protein
MKGDIPVAVPELPVPEAPEAVETGTAEPETTVRLPTAAAELARARRARDSKRMVAVGTVFDVSRGGFGRDCW